MVKCEPRFPFLSPLRHFIPRNTSNPSFNAQEFQVGFSGTIVWHGDTFHTPSTPLPHQTLSLFTSVVLKTSIRITEAFVMWVTLQPVDCVPLTLLGRVNLHTNCTAQPEWFDWIFLWLVCKPLVYRLADNKWNGPREGLICWSGSVFILKGGVIASSCEADHWPSVKYF